MLMLFPTGVIETPPLPVRATTPLLPFSVTTLVSFSESKLLLKLISKPVESWLLLATSEPAKITFPPSLNTVA
jgi:hypothetical protein